MKCYMYVLDNDEKTRNDGCLFFSESWESFLSYYNIQGSACSK